MTPAAVAFILGIVALLIAMALRKNVVLPAVAATFLTALFYDGNVVGAVMAVFRASVTSGLALFELFVVIACVTAMLAALRTIGSDVRMTVPFTKVMVNGPTAYVVLFVVTYLLSLVFWPTPALALVGALLLPAAIKAGLPPLACGIAIALSGQGMSIASDYVIGLGPSITASGAPGLLSVEGIAVNALVVSWVVGAVAVVLAYVLTVRPQIRAAMAGGVGGINYSTSLGAAASHSSSESPDEADSPLADFDAATGPRGDEGSRLSKVWAVIVPLTFAAVLVYMLLGRFTDVVPWEDGAGAAFVGGTAALLMFVVVFSSRGREAFEEGATHFVDGLSYAFKAMGVMIPVAGFFYLGIPDYSGEILGLVDDVEPPQFLFDLVQIITPIIPANSFAGAIAMVLIGMVTALDGTGWAGLPLIGGITGQLAGHVGIDSNALAALGQNAANWTGGGTLITWSTLIAVASFARVSVVDLARSLLIPVVTGLLVAAAFVAVVW